MVCHHEPGCAGVVIQLDGHGAERLAMTFLGFIAAITQAATLAAGSRNDGPNVASLLVTRSVLAAYLGELVSE